MKQVLKLMALGTALVVAQIPLSYAQTNSGGAATNDPAAMPPSPNEGGNDGKSSGTLPTAPPAAASGSSSGASSGASGSAQPDVSDRGKDSAPSAVPDSKKPFTPKGN